MKHCQFNYLLFILFWIHFISVVPIQGQLDQDLTPLIKNLLREEKLESIDLKSYNSQHPDYPILVILQAYSFEKKNNCPQALTLLETLRKKVFYSGLKKKVSSEQNKIFEGVIGTYGNFSNWRDFAYLILGRCYYEKKYYKEALESFSGISKSSPFFSIASISLIWSKLAMKSSFEINEIQDFSYSKEETKLQTSFYQLKNHQYLKAMEESKKIILIPKLSSHLQNIAFKVYAESSYKYFLKESAHWSFEKGLEHLQEVINIAEKIDLSIPSIEDPETLFFKAEAYWNLASLYRIKNPVLYEKEWIEALHKATLPLNALVSKTVSTQKALLREEAYFLALVVYWELEDYSKALPLMIHHKTIYPSGRYREDVHQLLGDYYFERHQFDKAKQEYSLLVKVASPDKATYGSYKASWAFYNMGEKWPALRQMERILLHFRKEKSHDLTEARANILKEAHQDMLLFMSELMDASKAIKELLLFNYQKDEEILAKENLAMTYKKIGKFEDSSLIYELLIKEHCQNKNFISKSALWLKELLDNDLRLAKRSLIPYHFNLYFPLIAKDLSSYPPQLELIPLYDFFSDLILTIHREAKKSDSAEIWPSVDQSYALFEKFFPSSKKANLWYHGAQRLEMTQNYELAKKWYQKAALIDDFKFREDAAYSYLNILKDQSDKISLKQVVSSNEHAQMAQEVFWYITHFNQRLERHFADALYLEHLFKSHQLSLLKDYTQKLITNEGITEYNKQKIKKVQSFLSLQQQWDELSLLMEIVFTHAKENSSNDPQFLSEVKILAQESAFQKGYISPNIQDSRYWYHKSINFNFSPEVTLKSYHNLFLSYHENELSELISIMEDFPEDFFLDKNIFQKENLLQQIWLHLSNLHQKKGNLLLASDAKLKSIRYDKNKENLYDILLIYGAFYEVKKFDHLLNDLKKDYPHFLSKLDRDLDIARIQLELGNISHSFHIAKEHFQLKKEKASPLFFLLIRDLVVYSEKFDESLSLEVRSWILENQEIFLKQEILTEIFDFILFHDTPLPTNDGLDFKTHLNQGENSSEKLLHFAQESAMQIEIFNKKVSEVSHYFKTPAPITREKMVCLVPEWRKKLISTLKIYLNNPINHKNWSDFEIRINSEIHSLSETLKKEEITCHLIQKNNISLTKKCLLPQCLNFSPLKDNYNLKEHNLGEIIKMAKEERAPFLFHLLSLQTTNKAKRDLYQAFIRLIYQDPFNARPFFENCEKNGQIDKENDLHLLCKEWIKKINS